MDVTGLDLNFDGWVLAAAFIFGVIGMWLFREGRKRAQMTITFTGLALMIYPYFVSGRAANWLVGFALCGFAYYEWNR